MIERQKQRTITDTVSSSRDFMALMVSITIIIEQRHVMSNNVAF